MNCNPQQTLRNNHLFFGFTKSSRIVAKFLWALDQRPLAALSFFFDPGSVKTQKSEKRRKESSQFGEIELERDNFADQAAPSEKRLCCRDRAPVCFHKTGADVDDNRISVGTPLWFCRSRASVIVAWPRFKTSRPLIAKRRSDSIQRHAALLVPPLRAPFNDFTSKWGNTLLSAIPTLSITEA
jgi:hypothetical protein